MVRGARRRLEKILALANLVPELKTELLIRSGTPQRALLVVRGNTQQLEVLSDNIVSSGPSGDDGYVEWDSYEFLTEEESAPNGLKIPSEDDETGIESLALPARVISPMIRANVGTLGQLVSTPPADILYERGFGVSTLEALDEALIRAGYSKLTDIWEVKFPAQWREGVKAHTHKKFGWTDYHRYLAKNIES